MGEQLSRNSDLSAVKPGHAVTMQFEIQCLMMRALTSTEGEWSGVWTRQPQYLRSSHKTRAPVCVSVVFGMLTRAAVPVFSLSLLLTAGVGEAQNWGWGWGAQQKQKHPETYQQRQKYQSNQEFYYDYDEDEYYDGE